jgi:hypothetical protein
MSNVPMPQMPGGMIGGQQQEHPSISIIRKFLLNSVTKEEAVDAFCDYIMTGTRGIPVPNIELSKSVINSETAHAFMGYPQIMQCMAVVIKNS